MPSATALAKRTCSRCGKTFESDAAFCPNDGTKLDGPIDPDVDPYIGATLPGDIEIRSIAGAGAMGKVYRAHQRGIDRDVAVKILHRELSGNLPLVQRFHREAKIASKLQHPHVVEVYLTGQLPDGALYIVMEYLDGHSLAAATQSAGGRLDLTRALPIALQICDAVGEGHARGIVHRDLKPENVMLVRRAETSDFVKVLDFGIAKVSLGEQSMETAAGLIFGTARYISPEGAQGATVGPAGDVYSIAVMLYQLLCGRTPFDAEQPVGLLIKHIHESPPLLRSWPTAKDIPEPIARVIMENLVKEPTRRAPSARAFGNAIAAAAKEANVSFSDVGVVARMSMLDAARLAVDRTLDDAAMVPIPPSPGSAPTITSDEPPPPAAPKPQPRSVPPVREEKRRASAILVVLLAFLLGAALAALVVQQVGIRKDEEHDAHVARARRALVEGRYTGPPNDNVRDLVAVGLQRWPDDPALAQIKSETAHELVTRAMASRSSGDLAQARDLVKSALDFDPSDHAATILLDQYEDELDVEGGSAPRALIEVPVGRTRPAQRVELIAKITIGGASPRGVVNNPRFTVKGPGLPEKGLVMTAAARESGVLSASVVLPREGNYDVVFEANTEGIPFRAERSLDVTK